MNVADSYTAVAVAYAEALLRELDEKPLDRALLDRLIARAGDGVVGDLGCGPGQVARYLRDHGADALGVDLAPGMVALARRLHPDARFEEGDLQALPLPDGSLAAAAAFYAIVHHEEEALPAVFREMRRVLRPGGWLLVAFHVGDGRIHRDELFGVPVDLDFLLHPVAAVGGALVEAGFDALEVTERPPYPAEHPTRRAYVLARA